MIDSNEPFELVSKIDINLTDDEKEDLVYEWLFLTTWLNQVTGGEFETAEEIMNFIFRLINKIYGTEYEIR